MRNATHARIGRGKVIHAYYAWCARTDCGVGGMSDVDATETSDAVTCKRCLKALAALIVRDHQEALDTHAALVVSSTQITETPKETKMRKLSEAQVNTLTSIHTTGYAPAAKRVTLESLVTRGSMFFAGGGYVLTTQGRTEIGADVTPDVLPPVDPAVTMIDEITADLIVEAPERSIADGGYDVRKPVALDREGRRSIRHWLRPAEEVQADRDALVQQTTEEHADVVLDTWYVVGNRADRRAEHKSTVARRRREMRHTRRPSRRRFTSEAAKIRKANRRVQEAAFTQNRLDFLAKSGSL